MNKELVELLLKLGLGVVIIMAAIAFCALLTPKLAKFLEKKHPPADPSPERVDDNKLSDNNSGPSEVKGPYDPQKEDYDLNYKIYNTDIYGVDFKHGKEKRKKG